MHIVIESQSELYEQDESTNVGYQDGGGGGEEQYMKYHLWRYTCIGIDCMSGKGKGGVSFGWVWNYGCCLYNTYPVLSYVLTMFKMYSVYIIVNKINIQLYHTVY